MRATSRLMPLLLGALALCAAAVDRPPVPPELARQYFGEAQAACQRDGGRLWGVALCGPILLVDGETRAVISNRSDAEGRLQRQGDLWVGALPEQQNVANTATEWAGVRWTMLMTPLPDQKQARGRLMIHELFHRVQEKLGLAAVNPSNRHLDAQDGRIWLQMEWRALERALQEHAAVRLAAIQDALVFRRYRQSLFPKAAAEEKQLELNEGLAEYTGQKLSTRSPGELLAAAGCELRQAYRRPTFARSFAYLSGPAYGALLDQSRLPWRPLAQRGRDLGQLLASAYGLKLPPGARLAREALRRAPAYDGDELAAMEARRETERQQQLAKYRGLLLEQPVLVLPLSKQVSYSFNPNNVVALDETATVYPTLRVVDEWGILEVSGGGLVVRQGGWVARVQVSAPADAAARPLEGSGWKLALNPGWQLAPGARPGDWTVKRP